MIEKEIKLLFDNGVITSATIVESPVDHGYWIHFTDKTRPLTPLILDTQRGDRRSFKSLDSCWNTISKIGLKRATISCTRKQ